MEVADEILYDRGYEPYRDEHGALHLRNCPFQTLAQQSAELEPRGVGVVLEAEHQCMTIRGVQAGGSKAITSTMYGLLRERVATRQEFLALIGVNVK